MQRSRQIDYCGAASAEGRAGPLAGDGFGMGGGGGGMSRNRVGPIAGTEWRALNSGGGSSGNRDSFVDRAGSELLAELFPLGFGSGTASGRGGGGDGVDGAPGISSFLTGCHAGGVPVLPLG